MEVLKRAVATVATVGLFLFITFSAVNSQDLEIPGARNLGSNVNSPQKDYAPVISADGNTLYFTSNRPGGRGETDFWYSNRTGSSWGPAMNLGPPINTRLPEGTCTITPSQTMVIFAICDEPGAPASQRKGYGSCDLYWSRLSGNQWSTPVNMGKPINTKFWDSRPSIAADGRTLYFASERPVGLPESYWKYLDGDYPTKWPEGYQKFYRNHDIYRSVLSGSTWSRPQRLGSAVNTPAADTSPFIHADGVSLYFSSNGRGGRGGLDIFRSTLQADGTFADTINLGSYDPGHTINTSGDDYFFTIPASGDVGYLSARGRSGGLGDFDIYKVPLPYELRPKKITTLSGIVYNVKTVGKPDASATVYHVDRISGQQRKVRASPIGRSAEIKLVDFSTGDVVKRDQSHPRTGKYTAIIDADRKYVLTVKAKCFFPYEKNFDIPREKAGKNLRLDIPLKPMVPGEGVVLPNIFFEFDKATLKPESYPALDRVVALMQEYPTINVELGGHTDCVGSDSYNQKLSEQRAEACRQYLIRKGISPTRIKAVGYGESQPIDPNCDPRRGNQINRRTEFKILHGLDCD